MRIGWRQGSVYEWTQHWRVARMLEIPEDDLLGVLRHAAINGIPGTFNVAGDGLLTLAQAVRRLGTPSVAMPRFAVGRLGATMRQARLSDFSPEQLGFLTYGRGVDTTRMRTVLGFEPSFTTAEAFADFCRSVAPATQPMAEGARRG